MVSECVRPVDGGRLCLHEGIYKRKEVGSPACASEASAGRSYIPGRLGARERQPYINPPNDFPLSGMCSVALQTWGLIS